MIEIAGLVVLSWSMFQLGRWYERDHPVYGITFAPGSSWEEARLRAAELERRGPFNWKEAGDL